MTKKLVEIEYDDNLHLGNASDGSGRKRGTLYNDNNELKGQVYIREVDEAEWGDGRHPADFFSEENSESESKEDYTLSDEDWERITQVAAFSLALLVKGGEWAFPRIKRWWVESAKPWIMMRYCAARERVGKRKKSGGQSSAEKSEVRAESSPFEVLCEHPEIMQHRLISAYKGYREDMTSSEAQKTLIEIVVLSGMISERVSRLSSARIVDGGSSRYGQAWTELVDTLSSERIIEGVNRILMSDGAGIPEESSELLEKLLGRKLFMSGDYIPISSQELKKRIKLPS